MVVGSAVLAQGDAQQQQRPQAAASITPAFEVEGARHLLEHIHHINQMEISQAQLALQKTQSPQVRQYAERMVREHQALDQRLMTIAKEQGVNVGQFKPINNAQQRIQDLGQAVNKSLQELEGALFDQQYLATQVAQHDFAIGLVTAHQDHFPKFTPLLNEALPVLQAHRDVAYNRLGQVQPRRQARTPMGEGGR
jgi:putative membrane protein